MVVAALFVARARGGAASPVVPFSDLLRDLDRAGVRSLVVNGDTLEYTQSDGRTFRTTAPSNYVTANPSFITDLSKRGVRIDVRSAPDQSAYSYGALLLGLGF